MSHVRSSFGRRWRYALATTLATTGLAAGVVLVPVQASPPTTGQSAAQASQQSAGAVEARRGNPKAFKFYQLNGKTVHWNRCRAIGYRVYLKGAPAKAKRDAQEAMRRVNKASGLKFRYRGISRTQPHRKGTGYARDTSLVIGWLPKERFNGNAGLGGWWANGDGGITSGFVMINRAVKLRPGFGVGQTSGTSPYNVGTTGQILMHEAGHAVGLDHVKDKAQILYPQMRSRPATWGAGDYNGLKKLGRIRSCN